MAETWVAQGIYPELDFTNDSFQTKTIVKKSQSGCSTGDLGGALGLLTGRRAVPAAAPEELVGDARPRARAAL